MLAAYRGQYYYKLSLTAGHERNGSRNTPAFTISPLRTCAPWTRRPVTSVLRVAGRCKTRSRSQHARINVHPPSQQTCVTRSDQLPADSAAPPLAVDKEQLQQLFQQALDPSTPTHLPWSLQQLCGSLNTSLSSGQPNNEEQLSQQRALFGANSLPDAKPVTFWELVVEALQDFTLLMLIGAGFLSLALASVVPGAEAGDWIEGAAILASALVVVLVAAGTNFQKEMKFRELNSMRDDVEVRVVRGGRERAVSVRDVVVGDIVLVEGGDILPADGLLLPGGHLKLDESHLTGESDDVIKGAGPDGDVLEGDASPAMVFSGSKVLEGFGRVLVLAVGQMSQQGVIGSLGMGQEGSGGENLREDTLLVQKLDVLAKEIGEVGLAAAAGVLVLNLGGLAWDLLRRGESLTAVNHLQECLSCVMNAITVLVVAVPEGLPLAVTLALAFSVQRMLADKTLVRQLAACETMASTTSVLSDKTGTLTENNMRVVRIWAGGCSYRVRPSATGRTSAPPPPPPPSRLRPILPAAITGNGNMPGFREPRFQQPIASMQSTSMGTLSSISMISLSVDDDSIAAASAAAAAAAAGASATATAVLEPQAMSRSARSKLKAVAEADAPWDADSSTWCEEGGFRWCKTDASGLPLPREVVDPLLMNMALNSTACVQIGKGGAGRVDAAGNRTECALLEFALRLDPSLQRVDTLRRRFNVLQVLPFTSQRKSMTTVVMPADIMPGESPAAEVFTKGAAEVVLKRCRWQVDASGQVVELPEATKQQVLDSFSREGLRVLALAYKLSPPEAGLGQLEEEVKSGMVLAGVVGLEDPLRPEVPLSIQQCRRAGITVRMLTGDNPVTAISIARKCGILPEELDIDAALATSRAIRKERGVLVGLPAREPGQAPVPLAIEAPRLREMLTNANGKLDEAALLALWPHLLVVARCTPSDKYMLVAGAKKLRAKGLLQEVVAVTGDGTNDAPALRAADVGFAMNSGTGIAKDAADILLMNDSFSSVVAAARWGRNVYAGISRFLQFQLTANVVAVATAALGAICLRDSPLSAVQMLWVNLIMDSLASLALATEPPTEELLDSPPVGVDQPLVSAAVTKHITGQAVLQLTLMALLVLQGESMFNVDHATCHTLVFNTFVWLQLFNQVNCRRVRDEPNPFQGVQGSPLFLTILSVEAVLQVLIVQYGGKAFSTVPLSPGLWAACISLGALSLAARAGLRLVPAAPIAQLVASLRPGSAAKT